MVTTEIVSEEASAMLVTEEIAAGGCDAAEALTVDTIEVAEALAADTTGMSASTVTAVRYTGLAEQAIAKAWQLAQSGDKGGSC